MGKTRIANALKKKIKDLELKQVNKEAEILKHCMLWGKTPRDPMLKLKFNIISDFIPSLIREHLLPWVEDAPENPETCNLANEQQPVKSPLELANEVYQSNIEYPVYSTAWKPPFKETENE